MSTSLDRMTKIELRQQLAAKDARISEQDRQITVLQGQVMSLKSQIDQWATTELTRCYQCDVPSPQLSKRSRCAHCECERSLLNEKELEAIQDRSDAAASDLTDCRIPHSKFEACHNCEPVTEMTLAQLSREYCGERKLKVASEPELRNYAHTKGITIIRGF